MTNKMLIDASHPEETRVVVLRGNRVEEFDFESASRKQLRGNIYLAKVTRVEPSLQAAFVDYGGNRHGFLAFSEIHPDYYQIPVADRQALLAEASARAEDDEEDDSGEERRGRRHRGARDEKRADTSDERLPKTALAERAACGHGRRRAVDRSRRVSRADAAEAPPAEGGRRGRSSPTSDRAEPAAETMPQAQAGRSARRTEPAEPEAPARSPRSRRGASPRLRRGARRQRAPAKPRAGVARTCRGDPTAEDEEHVEQVGGDDAIEEVPSRPPSPPRRQYKIQEVIKRRQVLLVQVVKEERGNKGAALTTYLSLAGRYSVLMPNTARGGGISRKITNASDRKRLKEIVAGAGSAGRHGGDPAHRRRSRTKAEIKRDFEYLLRLWENVRELTLHSTAPTLVYEEGA